MNSIVPSISQRVRSFIESASCAMGYSAIDHPARSIALVLLVTTLLGAGMSRIRVETDAEDMLRAEDPARVAYDVFRDQFGREDAVVIAIDATEGVFRQTFLDDLVALHEDVEANVPYLFDVTSLANVRETQSGADGIRTDALLAQLPANAEELDTLERRALENPIYLNWLVSHDGRFTAMVVTPVVDGEELSEEELLGGFEEAGDASVSAPKRMTRAQNQKFVQGIREAVARSQKPGFEPMLAGGPLTGEALQVGMERDLSVFLSLAIVIIAGLLFAIFRRRRSFRQSRPIAAELAQFTSLSEVPGRRWTSRHHWDLVKSMMRGGNWLEVGCASGLFLERVSHAGWRVTGIEPSLSLRRYAEQKLSMGT